MANNGRSTLLYAEVELSNAVITAEQATGNVLQELEEAFFDIPFENSDFQNRAFVVAAQQTPARAYRAIGLRMHAKIRAVKEYQYARAKLAIDIEEREAKIADERTDPFERRRMELENAKARDEAGWGEKLLNDALRELDCLYAEFNKLPRYNREQFEAEEEKHFLGKLNRQLLPGGGARESLDNMRIDLKEWDSRVELSAKDIALLEMKA